MLTMRFNKMDMGRVWLNDMPGWAYEPIRVEERSLPAGSGMNLRPRAAVELMLPRGPRSMYGALGVSFTPAPAEALIIRVGVTGAPGSAVKDALAGALDHVEAGLLPEFVSAVMKGLTEQAGAEQLGSGVLAVTHAACGRAGSNAWLFERLARSVVLALTAPADTDWAAALTALLK